MFCQTIEHLLALYVDDALTPVESRQVESHLQTCPACRSLLVALKDDQCRLKSLPAVLPPDGFREALLRKTAAAKKKQPAAWYLLPRLGSLAATIMIVLLTSNLYLFPMIWPGQSASKDSPHAGIMMSAPEQRLQPRLEGDALQRSTTDKSDDARSAADTVSEEDGPMIMFAAAPPAESQEPRPNHWLWSSLVGLGVFGLGTSWFLYRYRRV